MLYPLYVHRDRRSGWGGTFPDFPACVVSAGQLADLPRKAREAVEVFFASEAMDIPAPGDVEQWQDHPDFQGGYWLLVDIDPAKVNARPLRLNVSLPSALVQRIDRYATAHHMTRSGFLARAALEALEGGR